jgi:antitoxin (DNA-binding transcriptional repressor) of toxin-antitoxin stability system
MPAITMRTLSRETARVVEELAASPGGVVVTRDGIPVARVLPVSAVERELYAHLIAMGVDPWNPPEPDPEWTMAPPSAPGEKTASDYLMEDRDSYYEEP